MALMGLPAAIIDSRLSSWGDSSFEPCTGRTSAPTMAGSSIEPPVATSRMARASWSPSAMRSFNR